jgi:AcrR family transcriptional regulator
MGRKAGVTSEETRQSLIDAAARVFAQRGYEGASVAEITSEAGLSSGSIYAHYEGKAELFMAVLESRTRSDLTTLLHEDAPLDIGDLLSQLGSNLDSRGATERTLLIEAIMAAKSDARIHDVLSRWFREGHSFMAAALSAAQQKGTIADDFSASAAARFAQIVALGSWVIEILETPEIAHDDWVQLISRVVYSFATEESRAARAKSNKASKAKGTSSP